MQIISFPHLWQDLCKIAGQLMDIYEPVIISSISQSLKCSPHIRRFVKSSSVSWFATCDYQDDVPMNPALVPVMMFLLDQTLYVGAFLDILPDVPDPWSWVLTCKGVAEREFPLLPLTSLAPCSFVTKSMRPSSSRCNVQAFGTAEWAQTHPEGGRTWRLMYGSWLLTHGTASLNLSRLR